MSFWIHVVGSATVSGVLLNHALAEVGEACRANKRLDSSRARNDNKKKKRAVPPVRAWRRGKGGKKNMTPRCFHSKSSHVLSLSRLPSLYYFLKKRKNLSPTLSRPLCPRRCRRGLHP